MAKSASPQGGSAPEGFQVWAVARVGRRPKLRGLYETLVRARFQAERIARSSGKEGAVSVWVEGWPTNDIYWAAGEQAQAVMEDGYVVDYHGNVRAGAPRAEAS